MTMTRTLTRQDVDAMLREVDAAIAAQNMVAAVAAAERAIDAGVPHPWLLSLVAEQRRQTGWTAEAITLAERARAMAPRDPQVLTVLAECLAAAGRDAEAVRRLDEALAAASGAGAAWFTKARLHEKLQEMAPAAQAYERAFEAEPRLADAAAKRAWLAATAGEAGAAREWAAKALALSPSSVTARLAQIHADLIDGRFVEAGDAAVQITEGGGVSPLNQALAKGLLGDALDAMDRTPEAFGAYRAQNEILRQQYAGAVAAASPTPPLETARRLHRWFETDRPWPQLQVAKAPGEPRTHAFLLGFPRSGTTLLEQVLSAHPKISTMAEKDALAGPMETFLSTDSGLERLGALGAKEAGQLRAGYFEAARDFGADLTARVFVDKLPLYSVALPLLARLFPDAKFLLARRDPRDVILSCFRRRFRVTPLMYQFLDLHTAAAYYDAVMQLTEIYLQKLDLDVRVVRHEDLVRDFQEETRAICQNLGVGWNKAMAGFAQAGTGAVATPSAPQVAAGLTERGMGQWRRYREQLGPVLPVLEPWIERFGYEPS